MSLRGAGLGTAGSTGVGFKGAGEGSATGFTGLATSADAALTSTTLAGLTSSAGLGAAAIMLTSAGADMTSAFGFAALGAAVLISSACLGTLLGPDLASATGLGVFLEAHLAALVASVVVELTSISGFAVSEGAGLAFAGGLATFGALSTVAGLLASMGAGLASAVCLAVSVGTSLASATGLVSAGAGFSLAGGLVLLEALSAASAEAVLAPGAGLAAWVGAGLLGVSTTTSSTLPGFAGLVLEPALGALTGAGLATSSATADISEDTLATSVGADFTGAASATLTGFGLSAFGLTGVFVASTGAELQLSALGLGDVAGFVPCFSTGDAQAGILTGFSGGIRGGSSSSTDAISGAFFNEVALTSADLGGLEAIVSENDTGAATAGFEVTLKAGGTAPAFVAPGDGVFVSLRAGLASSATLCLRLGSVGFSSTPVALHSGTGAGTNASPFLALPCLPALTTFGPERLP